MPVASQLRSMLEAEAEAGETVFHAGLQAVPIPSMGGGMGIIATAPIPAGAVIARLPFRSMITAKKAALNLAMAELAVEAGSATSPSAHCPRFRGGVVPFAALPLSDKAAAAMFEEDCSAAGQAALAAKLAYVRRTLSATDTIVCYLLLMASLYGRWEGPLGGTSAAPTCDDSTRAAAGGAAPPPPPRLRFTHANRWMGRWIRCLPAMYDNLLEVGIYGGLSIPADAPACTEERVLRGCLSFPRHRATVVREHREAWGRYDRCVRALACLRSMPSGELAGSPDADSEGGGGTADARPGAHAPVAPRACTMEQFMWALNTLLSRGFSFDEDVWAMMPYVDYFNYALDANGSMSARSTAAGSAGKGWRRGGSLLRPTRLSSAPDSSAGGSGGWRFTATYAYVFTTTRPIEAGQQIFLHYGAYSDFELLTWYGFTLSPFLRPQPPLSIEGVDTPMDGSPPLPALIRALQYEEERRAVFARYRAQQAGESARDQTAGADDAAGEAAWEEWQAALQRAYSHVFTPLADSDGAYPAPGEGCSWVGDLVEDFLVCCGGLDGSAGCGDVSHGAQGAAESRVEAWATYFAREWHTHAASRARLMELKGLSTAEGGPAALGVLGPSWKMAHTLRWMGSNGVHAAYVAQAEESGAGATTVDEQVAAVRAIAWMELSSSRRGAVHSEATVDTIASPETGAASRTIVSRAAVAMAQGLSDDVAALLRYLAVEATDLELREYIARDGQF